MSECEVAVDVAARGDLVRVLLGAAQGFEGHEIHQERMLSLWVGYMRGKVPAATLVDSLSTYYDKGAGRSSSVEKEDDDVLSADKGDFFRHVVLPLMLDMERRATIQLALYKKFPKFRVHCCSYGHCFACKTGYWHEGVSCEEMQRAQLGTEAQFCSSCGVPTIRTEGCSDMLCVCGATWTWKENENES